MLVPKTLPPLEQQLIDQSVTTMIVCALHCEAKPLIDALKLKKVNDIHVFSVYHSGSVFILISGVGKQNMAAAINWMNGYLAQSTQPQFWLNLGVAGHKKNDIGELFCADKISNDMDNKRYFPTKWLKHKIPLAHLITVEQQEEGYPQNCLYDMEGNAFYQAASRFQSQEHVQCLKVVADNQDHKPSRNKSFITGLIAKHCQTVLNFIQFHTAHLSINDLTIDFKSFQMHVFKHHHFSHSQQLQFKKGCQSALCHDIDLTVLDVSEATNTQHILNQLNQLLHKQAVEL